MLVKRLLLGWTWSIHHSPNTELKFISQGALTIGGDIRVPAESAKELSEEGQPLHGLCCGALGDITETATGRKEKMGLMANMFYTLTPLSCVARTNNFGGSVLGDEGTYTVICYFLIWHIIKHYTSGTNPKNRGKKSLFVTVWLPYRYLHLLLPFHPPLFHPDNRATLRTTTPNIRRSHVYVMARVVSWIAGTLTGAQ